jgi:aspartate carbamoyltransferase regulatory subunit
MNEDKDKLIVSKIENGTVIDRIPPGKALRILKVLGIDSNYPYTVALAIRVASKKMSLKDVVKIKGKEFSEKEIHKMSFIAPGATVNIIQNYEVQKKIELQIPEHVDEFVECLNPNCVSNSHEPITSSFDVISKNPLILRCIYCDRVMEDEYLSRKL